MKVGILRTSTSVFFLLLMVAAPVSARDGARDPSGWAPKEGMSIGSWANGLKEFFGTAYEDYDSNIEYTNASPTAPLSKVWYTGAEGILTEVFWPTIDRKQIRDSQFLVSDGRSFLYEERRDSISEVQWADDGVPAYRVSNRDPQGRFRIDRTIFADPDRDVVIMKIKIVRSVAGLRFYYLHNPAAGNTSLADSARVSINERAGGPGLYAWDGADAQALIFSLGLKQASASFEAANDGYQDLLSDFTMDSHFEWAHDGNVVATAWLDIPETVGESEFNIALGFGTSVAQARSLAASSLNEVPALFEKFKSQWSSYLGRVRDLSSASTDDGQLFRASVAVLKSMEDKSFEGAFVASPSVPWGQHSEDRYRPSSPTPPRAVERPWDMPRANQVGGYHLVWPRDLYQMATTFLAIDDPGPAIASLKYFRRIQFGSTSGTWRYGTRVTARDGSFLQNCWVNGEPFWYQLQMDQTAYPVILTYRLWQMGLIKLGEFWNMAQRAADFVARFGPWSAQERWEENFGVSPSSVSAQISALWVAAKMAEAMGDHDRARKYLATADAWNSKPGDNLEAWTFTETGGLGNGKYYQRVEAAGSANQTWNPNDESRFYIGNNGGSWREKDVIDGGFLETVRFGIRSAVDYHVTETIHEYDSSVRVNTSKGPAFFRYIGDRYNYDNNTGRQTRGMLWPFLTGERGHYELQKAIEVSSAQTNLRDVVAVTVPYITAMEEFATRSLMLPEQVWDAGARQGEATGAATPLGWTHGEYLKLLRSRQEGRLSDRLDLVSDRGAMLNSMEWSDIQKLHQR